MPPDAVAAVMLGARVVTLAPTESSGVVDPSDTTHTTTAPTGKTKPLKSSRCVSGSSCPTGVFLMSFITPRQHKPPVGLIVGVAIAIIALIAALFLVRYLFLRRTRRRDAARPAALPAKLAPPTGPPPMAATGADAVELGHYPPSSTGGSWPQPFSASEPGAGASPAARQAYLAAELRAAQALLERGGRGVDVPRTKARIRELEARQQSAWALGLE
ncbi:hypothetical protein B0H10DRAFT_323491 [Mycena sp. CBHHK59/15]|nr:hypothetical protein B0H10DRAFT_323491 [Mycena sp. CBHHK59/15]